MVSLNDLLNRLLKVENGQSISKAEIEQLKSQVASLNKQLNELRSKHNTDISKVNASISSTRSSLEQKINSEIAKTRASTSKDISAINSRLASVEKRVPSDKWIKDVDQVVSVFRGSPQISRDKINRISSLISKNMFDRISFTTRNLGNSELAKGFIRSNVDSRYIEGMGFIKGLNYPEIWRHINGYINTSFLKSRGVVPTSELGKRVKDLGFLDGTHYNSIRSRINCIMDTITDVRTSVKNIRERDLEYIRYRLAKIGDAVRDLPSLARKSQEGLSPLASMPTRMEGFAKVIRAHMGEHIDALRNEFGGTSKESNLGLKSVFGILADKLKKCRRL